MPRNKKSAPESAVEPTQVVVSSCFVEEDNLEDAVTEQRRRLDTAISLGNGGYITRARAMSDEA